MASLSEIRARALAARGLNSLPTILGVWDKIGDAPDYHDIRKLQVEREYVRDLIEKHCDTGRCKVKLFMRHSIVMDYSKKTFKVIHSFIDPKLIDLFERGIVVEITPVGRVNEESLVLVTAPLVLLDDKELWKMLIFDKVVKFASDADPIAVDVYEVYGLLYKEITPEERDLYMEYLKYVCKNNEKRIPGIICLMKDGVQPVKFMDYLKEHVPSLYMRIVTLVYGLDYIVRADPKFGETMAVHSVKARREMEETVAGRRPYAYSMI